MMASTATRPSQDAEESAAATRSAEHDGHAPGSRRGSADSFRGLLARLKKSAETVQNDIALPQAAESAVASPAVEPQQQPAVAAPPEVHAPARQQSALATPPEVHAPAPLPAAVRRDADEAAQLAAREREIAASLAAAAARAASPTASVDQRVDAMVVERRARARTEAHVASQEIIARLRKAAAEQAAAKARAEAELEQPAELTAELPAAPQEIAPAAPVAQQPVAEAAITPEPQPVQPEPVAEQQPAPAIKTEGRRRHPFFPDVFLDDEPAAATSAAQATAELPPPVEQPVEVADVAASIAELIAPQAHAEQPVAEFAPVHEEPPLEAPIDDLPAPAAELPVIEQPAIEQPEISSLAAEAEIAEVVAPVGESWPVEEPVQAALAPVVEEQPALALAPDFEPAVEPAVETPAAPALEAAEPVAEAVAEAAEVPAPVEAEAVVAAATEAEDQHQEDLVEDEADAVRHLRGVEVKGIGDIAKTIFSAPTPAERAAFLAEIAALTAAEAAEPVLAASEQTIAKAQPSVRKVAAADDPFAKIEPDVSGFVNHDEPDEDSGELARSLLDMMLSNPNAGLPQERALAADALLKLIPKVPSKALVNIAERLAMMESPPHLLIAKLINDPRIEIAGPLLEQCNHISDQVLSKVIAGGQVSLQRLIARRRHLSSALSDQLIEFDDPSVLLTLVRNNGAAFSHTAFGKLMLHASRHTDALAPLATRSDLPPTIAFELFWYVPAELRRYLLSRFLTDSETLTKILKITKVMQGGSEAGDQGFANKEALDAFITALEQGLGEDAVQLLAAMSGISAECAHRIMSDSQGEPIAIVFKAIGVNRAQFEQYLARLQAPELAIVNPARQPVELQSTFNSMSFNKARIVLTYWDWAVLKHGPYAEAQ